MIRVDLTRDKGGVQRTAHSEYELNHFGKEHLST